MSEEFDMSQEERQELIVEFLGESEGHLETLNDKLLQAETAVKEFTDMPDADLDAMFRAAHTIKGTASFIGLSKVVELTHELETILQRLKKKEMRLTEEVIDVLFMGLDVLQSLVTDLKECGDEKTDITEAVSKVQAVLSAEDQQTQRTQDAPPLAEASSNKDKPDINTKYLESFILDAEQNIEIFNKDLMTLEKEPKNIEIINNLFRLMHSIKGASGIVGAQEIQSVAHSMENILSLVRERQEAFSDMFSLLFKGIDTINGLVNSLKTKQSISYDVTPLINQLMTYLNKMRGDGQNVDSVETHQEPSLDVSVDLLGKVKQQKDRQRHLQKILEQDYPVFQIVVQIHKEVMLKSAKVLLVEERLKDVGTVIVMDPEVESVNDSEENAIFVHVLFGANLTQDNIAPLLSLDCVKVVEVKEVSRSDLQNILGEHENRGEKQNVSSSSVSLEDKKSSSSEKHTEHPPSSARQKPLVKKETGSKSSSAPVQISTIRIDTRKLDTLMNLSGELVTVRARFERLVSLFNEEAQIQRDACRQMERIRGLSEDLTREIRTLLGERIKDHKEARKLDAIKEQMMEGFAAIQSHMTKSSLFNHIHLLDETTSILGKIASDIQTGVMQTRMVPIEGVFTRFKRIVRDISKSINKQVDLVIEGEETELDKKLVESLGDPLTHMIRNACDHGIEDPQERKRVGKPEKGTVFLKASHRGNNICIEIGDDGKGLDPEALAQSALKKGLITEEQMQQLTEREKLNLMFLPGFSTAAKVTGLSGRGVGMDVVKNMITAVNGVVDIETKLGRGTTFILKIPLTLAIIQALLVVVGPEVYAIPLESVTEIIKVSSDEIYSIDGQDTVQLRNHVLSLVELERVIGIQGKDRRDQRFKRVVVITDGETQLGVVVDSLIGESEIVIKSLSQHFAKVKGISGATILGDGQIALILDPFSVVAVSKG